MGQMFIALAPETFTGIGTGPGALSERLETMLSALGEDDGVRLPGNSRHACREQAATRGIAVPADLLARLQSYT